MAPPKTYRCEAVILSYAPLGEADLLVTMFTKDPVSYTHLRAHET